MSGNWGDLIKGPSGQQCVTVFNDDDDDDDDDDVIIINTNTNNVEAPKPFMRTSSKRRLP
jgi:hypothetical protein